jgi:hypothetical protein
MRAKRSERDIYAAGLFASLAGISVVAAMATGGLVFVALAGLAGVAALTAFIRGFPIDRNW